MKKILLLSALFTAIFGSIGATSAQAEESNGHKILIAYYSHTGNTRKVAEAIQKQTGGDLFEIETVESYPSEYKNMALQAKLELANNVYPKLKSKVKNMADYDIVFIGSPNWWGNIAAPVSSFMAENDLKGKKVIPFITHGGKGEQNTIKGMQKKCIECNFTVDGYMSYNGRIWGIAGWLNKTEVLK